MDPEVRELLSLDGISKNLSIRKLIKYQLKYSLYFLVMGIMYVGTRLVKIKSDLDAMSTSYGILKTCKRCTYGKSRETLLIISSKGYSRDNKVLQVMNYNNNNWNNIGDCLGYSNCNKCIKAIDNSATLPCKWKSI
jgi:hypothetical protein